MVEVEREAAAKNAERKMKEADIEALVERRWSTSPHGGCQYFSLQTPVAM